MIVGAAQKAEAVRQHLQRPLSIHQSVELDPLLQDAEDQVLPLDAGVIAQVFLAGLLDQLGHRHPLQFGDMGVARLLDLLVAVVDFVAAGLAFGGDFLGQGKGLFLFQGPQRLVDGRRELLPAGSRRSVSLFSVSVSLSRFILLLLLKSQFADARLAAAVG